MAKSFDDLQNSFKLFIAGPASTLATFFSENLFAAAGALAVEMGYISEDQMPTLPGQIALDPERVTNVVETLNEVLESFGRKPARTVEELDKNSEEGVADEAEVARRTLDAADAVLDRLRKMTEEGA